MKIITRCALLLLVLLVPALALRWHGLAREPAEWWYPFVPAIFTDHYTAGPFAITSNTREDNPVWAELPAFNRMQARMSYVATIGRPEVPIAWLLPEASWEDTPVLPLRRLAPNRIESPLSRELLAAGLVYDRISRRDLLGASAADGTLVVGSARYRGLLVGGLGAAAPELLATLERLARAGVPVLWSGGFPARATGWADHDARDRAVADRVAALKALGIERAPGASLRDAFAARGVHGPLLPADGSPMRLRSYARQAEDERLLVLFNESDEMLRGRYVLDVPGAVAATLLDPLTGAAEPIPLSRSAERVELEIAVPARRLRVLRLRSGPAEGDGTGAMVHWQEDTWRAPPRSLHPFVRWWWPGNAVEPAELSRELRALHAAGFGGVELQTLTLGFRRSALEALEDRIYQVGTPAFFRNLRGVFEEAGSLGMTVDLTLGSGWSGGGPFIRDHPVQQLLQSWFDVRGPSPIDVPLPAPSEPAHVRRTNGVIRDAVGDFDPNARLLRVIAARVEAGTEPPTLADPQDITATVAQGRIRWDVPAGDWRILTIHQNASAQNAIGSAYPGALRRSPIFDHLGRGGVEEYIGKLGAPWLDALAPSRPRALFVDSFELIAELPWSDGFLETFRQMHGYDLAPWLPLVFRAYGESKYLSSFVAPAPVHVAPDARGERIREDYEATREQRFREAFLQPLAAWARTRGVALRVQAHGGYGDYLDSYQIADIPEAEDLFAGGSADFLKLASSAAHVAGRREVSSEAFIKLAFGFDTLDIEDYHLLAGNAFAAGITRTVSHGYAYHFPLRDTRTSAP